MPAGSPYGTGIKIYIGLSAQLRSVARKILQDSTIRALYPWDIFQENEIRIIEDWRSSSFLLELSNANKFERSIWIFRLGLCYQKFQFCTRD